MGIYKTMPATCGRDPTKEWPAAKKEKYEKLKKADQKMVRAQFLTPYRPGGTEQFFYSKHWDDPIMHFRGRDGDIYEVPKGMVDDINSRCTHHPQTGLIDRNGNPIKRATPKPIMRFVPVFD